MEVNLMRQASWPADDLFLFCAIRAAPRKGSAPQIYFSVSLALFLCTSNLWSTLYCKRCAEESSQVYVTAEHAYLTGFWYQPMTLTYFVKPWLIVPKRIQRLAIALNWKSKAFNMLFDEKKIFWKHLNMQLWFQKTCFSVLCSYKSGVPS